MDKWKYYGNGCITDVKLFDAVSGQIKMKRIENILLTVDWPELFFDTLTSENKVSYPFNFAHWSY